MNELLNRIFGINYRTSIAGVGVIVAAVSRVALAWKAQDFAALANDGQLIVETVAALLAGLGLFIAKDSSVTGAGTQAKSVDSAGIVTNVAGTEIGQQPLAPPGVR